MPRHAATAPAGRLRSPARGFSLIELGVVLAVGGALFLVLIRWLLGFTQATATNLDVAGPLRDASYAGALLRADLQQARGCDPYGLDAPLRAIQTDSVQIYADVTGDGITDLVAWRVADGALQRAVVTGNGDCSFDVGAASWATVSDHVKPAAVYFTPYRGGSPVSVDPYGSCLSTDAYRCLDDAVAVHAVITSGSPDSLGAQLSGVYPVSLAGSHL